MCIILYMIYDVDINYRMICSFLGDPMAVVLNSSVYNRQFTASKFQPRQAKLYAVGTHGYFSKDRMNSPLMSPDGQPSHLPGSV